MVGKLVQVNVYRLVRVASQSQKEHSVVGFVIIILGQVEYEARDKGTTFLRHLFQLMERRIQRWRKPNPLKYKRKEKKNKVIALFSLPI